MPISHDFGTVVNWNAGKRSILVHQKHHNAYSAHSWRSRCRKAADARCCDAGCGGCTFVDLTHAEATCVGAQSSNRSCGSTLPSWAMIWDSSCSSRAVKAELVDQCVSLCSIWTFAGMGPRGWTLSEFPAKIICDKPTSSLWPAPSFLVQDVIRQWSAYEENPDIAVTDATAEFEEDEDEGLLLMSKWGSPQKRVLQ